MYLSMSVEESSQCDHVKTTILKVYELVPEVYRQHFRSSQRQDTQTITEFAREKEVQFDCWCSAKEVAQDFNKLWQLMLLGEFKSCLTPQMKTYLDERKVDGLSQAAVHCKCKGHIMSECWEEKKKAKLNAVVNVKRDGHNLVTGQSSATKNADGNEVNPFISECHVSLTAGDDPVPIPILQDTGATQSLLTENILPLFDTISLSAHVLYKGLSLEYYRFPYIEYTCNLMPSLELWQSMQGMKNILNLF